MKLTIDYTDEQQQEIVNIALKHHIEYTRVKRILKDIYEANFSEDIKSVDEHLMEINTN